LTLSSGLIGGDGGVIIISYIKLKEPPTKASAMFITVFPTQLAAFCSASLYSVMTGEFGGLFEYIKGRLADKADTLPAVSNVTPY